MLAAAAAASGGADTRVLATATEVGARLAGAGFVVLTGGLDGVMAAAAHGARSAGGTAIGLLPGADPATGNEHLSVAVPTGLGQARNALLVTAADGLIAVGGSWGTLSEISNGRSKWCASYLTREKAQSESCSLPCYRRCEIFCSRKI